MPHLKSVVISCVEQISAAWLTEALHASGALRTGKVAALEIEASSSAWSRIARVTPHYEPQATGELPSALLLKMCAGGQAVFGNSEVLYYTRDYEGYDAAPLPRCYDAAYDQASQSYHLLLADLSATHHATWDLPKTLEHGCAVAESLARLHAHRWGDERLAEIGLHSAGAPELSRYFAHVQQGLQPLFEILGTDLDPKWRAALTDVFEQHPGAMRARSQNPVGFALVHGDANPGNILAPRQGLGPVYLIDRQPFDWSLQCWLSASDLAYMMVLFWEPAQRSEWQLEILRHYQATLRTLGIELSWDQLFVDYRLSVVQALESAVEWLVVPEDRTAKRWIWEPQLQRAMAAFFELSCGDLWSEAHVP
jgi:hypothetical protein